MNIRSIIYSFLSFVCFFNLYSQKPLNKTIKIKRIDSHSREQLSPFSQQKLNIKDNNKAKDKKTKHIIEKEITFAIIKPDAVKKNNTGDIIKLIELNNFEIIGLKKIKLNTKKARQFYKEHIEKPFFNDLVNYMTSGPIVILALLKNNAVQDWRKLMGATNPQKAELGTLRAIFGTSVTENALHGSDSTKSAQRELRLFF